MPLSDQALPASSYQNRLLQALSLLLAACVSVPIIVIILQWGTLGSGEQVIWQHLFDTKLGRLALNTLILVFGVGAGVTLLGVSLAWLTSVCEFPGRRIFEWALMLPLAIPGYVMAFVFLGIFSYAGPVQTQLRSWFGVNSWFPDIQSPGAVILIFSLVLYPYVFLLARTAFLAQGRSTMDAARVLGLPPFAAFLRVVIPVARPAIVGGVALALMETLADFGAVSVFGYDTFTTAIYTSWSGLFNLTVAAQLASLLLLFVAVAMTLEQYGRKHQRYTQNERRKTSRSYQLRGGRAVAATLFCCLILLIAFVIPVTQLLVWVSNNFATDLDSRYVEFFLHTIGLAAMAAVTTAAIALLLALGKRMAASTGMRRWQQRAERIATLGYALPGSVLAVGIMLTFTWVDQLLASAFQMQAILVNSVVALLLAYVIRFLAVAHAPVESGLLGIKPSVIEAARSLGASPSRVLREVYVPMLKPGLFTALLIVFVDVMKEMPATLMVRPFGWDTLAVRVFQMTTEGQWERAALPALTLLLAGLIPVILLVKNSRFMPRGC
ncbi:MAG: iron ABC transporter permease [Pseudomonadota bacterium]